MIEHLLSPTRSKSTIEDPSEIGFTPGEAHDNDLCDSQKLITEILNPMGEPKVQKSWNATKTICAIVRNEGQYLIEWFAYHRMIGVSRFEIYDNESTDETTDILLRLEKTGWLQRIPWLTPDVGSPQITAYRDFIFRHENDHTFAAFLDPDEFLTLPLGQASIQEFFASSGLMEDSVSAVAINQRVFGSAGKLSMEQGFVTTRFTKAAREEYIENRWIKSFFRPARVSAIPNSHVVGISQGRYVDAFGNDLEEVEILAGQTPSVALGARVNHYIIKSLEEFRAKQARGGASGATPEARAARYDDKFFFGRDAYLNEQDWSFAPGVIEATKEFALNMARPHE